MLEKSKQIKILYRCGKCNGKINPETFFCETCRYQFNQGGLSWVRCVRDFVILFILLAIIDWDMQMGWDFVESVQRHGKLMKLFVNVVTIEHLENPDSVVDVINYD